MGTFVVLHWHPCSERSWRDLFVSKRYDLPGQALLAACLLWPMYFSHVWPKTTLQLLLDGQDDKQIYIIFFLICKSKEKKKKAQILDFHQMSGGTKDKQETKLNNRRVVVMMAARSVFLWFQVCFSSCFSLPARPRTWDGRHLPPSSLPFCLKCGSNRINVQQKS